MTPRSSPLKVSEGMPVVPSVELSTMLALRISVSSSFLLFTAANVLGNASHMPRQKSSATSQAIIPLYIIPVTRVYNPFSNRDYDDELYQIPISIGTPGKITLFENFGDQH